MSESSRRRHASGTDSGRFAAGEGQRSRSAHGSGDVELGSEATTGSTEAARARCRTATGPATRVLSEAALRWRREHPRVVRLSAERVHAGPSAPVDAPPPTLPGPGVRGWDPWRP